jgi:hypothetical protein
LKEKKAMKASLVVMGDLVAIALVTVIGFATHGETSLAFLPRMGILFFPLSLGWLALGPWFGLFRAGEIAKPQHIWRAALAMVFVGPLALVVRGLILNAPIIPIFAVVLIGVSALGIAIWRAAAMLLVRRLGPAPS